MHVSAPGARRGGEKCDEAARRRRCSVFEKFPEAGNSPSPFLGSGTTLAASEATQRVCYGIVAMRVCGRFPNSPARAPEMRGEDLDGHVPIQPRVPRPVDLSVMKPHEDGAVVCLKSSLKPVTLR